MSEPQALQKWEVPKSYDIGVAYHYRNLLKGNPYQERFFKQWLARIDESNIKNYYDYETDKPLRSVRGGSPLEIDVDQIQRMVQSANLPEKIEVQLFDQIDYLTSNQDKISFKRVKELFAYAGIEGVYDLENKRHFQVEYDPPFTVDNLHIDRWNESDRVDMARMMAEKGEIPDHRQRINGLEQTIAELNMKALSDSGLHKKMQDATASFTPLAPGATIEDMERASRESAQNGNQMEAVVAEMAQANTAFEQSPEIIQLRAQIESLKQDEAIKLAKGVEKVPASMEDFPVIEPKFDMAWDESFERSINDTDFWAKAYFDGKGPSDFPSHEPDEAEAATLDRRYLEAGRPDLARYHKAYAEFEAGPLRDIRVRNAGFKDWILKDFSMNDINRGDYAKSRRLDVPRDFANAVKAEMADGLMSKIKAPIRIEKIADDSGRYTLVLNNLDVGSFHPEEVLSMATDMNEAPKDPKDIAAQKKKDEELFEQEGSLSEDDFDAHIPGEASPEQRRTEQARETAAKATPSAQPSSPGASAPKGAAAGSSRDQSKQNPYPGMGANPMAGMQGMSGMNRGMGGMGGMGMPPAAPPLFNFSLGMSKLGSFKGLPSRPGVFSRNAFDAGAVSSSINAKTSNISGLSSMLQSGVDASGAQLTADQTLRAWSDLGNGMKSLQEDIAKSEKYGDKKGTPELAEAIDNAGKEIRRARPFVDEKAKEPGAVGDAARKAKEHMDKLVEMIQRLIKMFLAMFSKGRSADREKDRESSPEPT